MFSIVPNTGTITFGAEQEAEEAGRTSLLYVVDITMPSYVEYTFRGIEIFREIKNYEIDEDSGPIEMGLE